ncbi:MAG: hypothetical protein ACXWDI_08750, partial [Nocardioides sp.]
EDIMRRSTNRSGRVPRQGGAAKDITFVEDEHGYWATDDDHRRWHVMKVFTGWRLEFRDPGDDEPTFAGVHGTLQAAMREAARN